MKSRALSLSVRVERWPIAGAFAISRGAKTEAVVVVAELSDGAHRGRGECVPYPRYGETVAQVMAAIETMAADLARGLDREGLQQAMHPGAARNALDCAFWDLAAKRAARPVHELLGEPAPAPLTTAYTISLAAPQARLIVDANEGWNTDNLEENLAACAHAGVTLVEQPLPAEHDDALTQVARPIAICADESAHASASLRALAGRYDAVNIKLDKAGGLTEALAMARLAEELGFALMVGCMVSTSLAMAPAMLLAQRARVVDLDGPLLLAHDRPNGLRYEGSLVHPPAAELWG